MTSISKNKYIDKLDDMVDKYNNTKHSTIKMKHVDLKSNEVPKFEIYNIVRIPKYKNIFAKAYVLNWSEDFLLQNTKYCSVDLCYK